MDHATAAQRLSTLLSLQNPPVALAFVGQSPDGIAQAAKPVPSACTFWRQAEQGTFYAAAAQHFNCPVGSMVMGFELPEAVGEQLGGLVKSMCDAGYLSMDEAAKIPTVGRASAGIVYGPLHEFPLAPDVVVLWVSVAQAMLYSEAAGRAAWTSAPMDVTGRPGCAALPRALNSNQPGMSLGCAGMRTFTEIGDDMNLAAIPGSALDGFIDALAGTVESNAAMRSFYSEHKAAIG
ncbi:MAG TPA: DUF169 domain-containing protein [Streptosporangiaceae bacterium]|jgi:uncharacterized protein (DUF169 family)|nr:DUF169 domain-containing protein [Streptosporangiaceae bacterium]